MYQENNTTNEPINKESVNNTQPTALDTARDYTQRGWTVTPVLYRTKRAYLDGWQNLQLTENELPEHFKGKKNIGVLLGKPSKGLIDIDLDCKEAIELAPFVLPKTNAIFGRASKPSSHYLYYVATSIETEKLLDHSQTAKSATVVEFRSTGCQTVFPGSIHESNESIVWDQDGEPATVDADELRAAVLKLRNMFVAMRGGVVEPKNEQKQTNRAEKDVKPIYEPTADKFNTFEERNAELINRMRQHQNAKVNKKGLVELNGICHGGEFSKTALFANPQNGKVKCNGGCEYEDILRSFGLPDGKMPTTVKSQNSWDISDICDTNVQTVDNTQVQVSQPLRHLRDNCDISNSVANFLGKIKPVSDLMSKEFAPINWIVPNMIPEGVSLFVAPPKIGKSLMALDLCLAAASCGHFLGTMKIPQNNVLLLDLENGERVLQKRIHSRLFENDAPQNFHYITEWLRFNEGGLVALDAFIESNNIKLVVIDTLESVRPLTSGKNPYREDYNSLKGLNDLSHKHAVAIVVIHHTNKENDSEDFVKAVSSTYGLTGAVDNIIRISRKRADTVGKLEFGGRLCEETSLDLTFDKDLVCWKVNQNSLSEKAQQIEMLLKGKDLSKSELNSEFSNHTGGINEALAELKQAGLIVEESQRRKKIYRHVLNIQKTQPNLPLISQISQNIAQISQNNDVQNNDVSTQIITSYASNEVEISQISLISQEYIKQINFDLCEGCETRTAALFERGFSNEDAEQIAKSDCLTCTTRADEQTIIELAETEREPQTIFEYTEPQTDVLNERIAILQYDGGLSPNEAFKNAYFVEPSKIESSPLKPRIVQIKPLKSQIANGFH